jgi:hypothetical protein
MLYTRRSPSATPTRPIALPDKIDFREPGTWNLAQQKHCTLRGEVVKMHIANRKMESRNRMRLQQSGLVPSACATGGPRRAEQLEAIAPSWLKIWPGHKSNTPMPHGEESLYPEICKWSTRRWLVSLWKICSETAGCARETSTWQGSRHLDGRVLPRVGVVHGRQTSTDVNDRTALCASTAWRTKARS